MRLRPNVVVDQLQVHGHASQESCGYEAGRRASGVEIVNQA